MKKTAIYILSLTAIFFVASFSVVSAQNVLPLTVSPARQTISINPGDSEAININFLNQADVQLAGNIKAVDFIVNDNQGSPILLEDGEFSNKYSGASWVKLPFDKAVILPNEQLKVQARLNAPADAAPGGRYVAIYFEPTGTIPASSSLTTGHEGIQSVGSKIVGLINIRVNGPITELASLYRFEVPKFIEFGPVSVVAEILNQGDYHITPKGNVVLKNFRGKIVDQYSFEEKNIFPEKSRIYNVDLGSKIMIGKYTVNLLATYGDANLPISRSATFWAFPIRIAIVIVLTILIIVLLVLLIGKQLHKKQKSLEKQLQEQISELEALKNKLKDNIFPEQKPQKK